MEELRERYEIIEEAANDAILTIDEQGKILSISRAAERIFGHRVPDMVGQPVNRIIPNYKELADQARHRGNHTPVIEVNGRTGRSFNRETSAVAMVTPADGPSLGIAPAGTWM